MKGFSQFGLLLGDKRDSLGPVVFAHGSLEIGKGLLVGLGLVCAPVHEEADGQAAQHPKDPEAGGVADPATVVIERDIQPLMGAALDAPALPVGPSHCSAGS